MAQIGSYHEGELQVQTMSVVRQEAQKLAAVIQQRLPTSAAYFIEQQTMAVCGSLDARGRVWASVVFGAPGFLLARDEQTVCLRRSVSVSAAGDLLWSNLKTNPQLGLLLIELTSRRRLRVNGKARFGADGDCLVHVQRAYGNCPKYIQRRCFEMSDVTDSSVPCDWQQGQLLNLEQQALVGNADTFFVASAHPEQGADASHRGGCPGFVRVLNPQRLRIPDFIGNNMFNTLGNFASYPSAGLVFIDFERGIILQLSGRPELLLNEVDDMGETGGTARYWEFEIETWRESRLPMRIEWEFLDYSPYIPRAREAGGDGGKSPLRLKLNL
jgi:predicted pyridoxine 5'-phosphate oxidase superfamily flavin-nucleotide-binding protein